VIQHYEDVLPYETFSLRLNNDDLPYLREILKGVTDDQYRKLLEGVKAYYPAFSWNAEVGGRAFDYTIASLRRKYMNLKVGPGLQGRHGQGRQVPSGAELELERSQQQAVVHSQVCMLCLAWMIKHFGCPASLAAGPLLWKLLWRREHSAVGLRLSWRAARYDAGSPLHLLRLHSLPLRPLFPACFYAYIL